jgi:hypothetical protein
VLTEVPPAIRPKPAANTAHKRQISEAILRNERLIARQARPEPAEGDALEDRQEDAERDAVADTAIRRSGRCASPKNAVEDRNMLPNHCASAFDRVSVRGSWNDRESQLEREREPQRRRDCKPEPKPEPERRR